MPPNQSRSHILDTSSPAYRAFTNSTRAVATGNTASINTGNRSAPSAK